MSENDGKKPRRNITRRKFLQTTAIAGAAMSAPWIWTSRKAGAAQPGVIPTVKDPRFSVPVIDPRKIDKFIDALTRSWNQLANHRPDGRLSDNQACGEKRSDLAINLRVKHNGLVLPGEW